MKKIIFIVLSSLTALSFTITAYGVGESEKKESKWTKTYENIERWGWKSGGDSSPSSSKKSSVKKKSMEVSPGK